MANRRRQLEQEFERLKLSEVKKTSRELGRGSNGVVFAVEMCGIPFAAKNLHTLIRSAENKRNFLDECLRCSRISHPNVVQFIGLYWPTARAEIPWLVMELMDKSLAKLIEDYATSSKNIPLYFKLTILLDTCKGLRYLHSKKIIHRDLSSNNILLTKNCEAKIADLGLAKVLEQGSQKHTEGVGTIAFRPPEGLLEPPKYDLSSDVFSLGCVCIHLVSMQFPNPSPEKIEDKKTGKILNQNLSEYQRREKYLTKFLHVPVLRNLVKRCLQNPRAERPESREVMHIVEQLKRDCCQHNDHSNDNAIDLYTSLIDHEEQLEEKEGELYKMSSQLQKKDQILAEKNQILAEKDQILAEKDKHLSMMQHQLSVTQRSLVESKDAKLFIKNFDTTVRNYHLRQMFCGFGKITDAIVVRWPKYQFGIVSFAKHEEAQRALKEMNGHIGPSLKPLIVEWYRSKEEIQRQQQSPSRLSERRNTHRRYISGNDVLQIEPIAKFLPHPPNTPRPQQNRRMSTNESSSQQWNQQSARNKNPWYMYHHHQYN